MRFNKRDIVLLCTSLALSLTFVSTSIADTITYVGEVNDAGSHGPVVFGTDGYDLYGTSPVGTTGGRPSGNRLTSLPSYITNVGLIATLTGAGYSYATIDNPAGGQVEAGHQSNSGPAGAEVGLVDLSIGSSAPSSFYIGFMTDISGSPDYPNSIRFAQSTGTGPLGDSGTIATIKTANLGVDFYLFRIDGAHAGDHIIASGSESEPNPGNELYYTSIAGLTFAQNPAVVPEPNAILGGLVLFGGLGLRTIARRRN